jgi:uncharacterized protein YndB with AHSA1/START domain
LKEYGTLKYKRRLSLPREIVWKAITYPKEIFAWMSDYKGVIDGYKGGAIDLVNTVSGSHVTGDILVWDLHRVFEYEWHISPNISWFPHGSLMENLNLLSGGSSSRTAIQLHSLV